MTIRDILREKGTQVITVAPDMSVLEAMRELVRHGIGAVVVVEAGEILGILSERDVLRHGARDARRAADTTVRDIMTTNPIVGVPDDSVAHEPALRR